MRLRIQVDAQRPLLALRDPGQKIQCGRRLPDTTFLIEYRDNRHRRILEDQRILRRTNVTTISARITTTKIASRIVATRFH